MKTQVCITVDIEFDINSTFDAPEARAPIGLETVRCLVEERDEGLGFILRTLKTHGLTGVFFVEALNTCYFGDEPMGAIARDIVGQGHDVELHLHPAWAYFDNPDWRRRLESDPPTDSMVGRTPDDLRAFITQGLQAFRRWNVPAPIAVRAGNLTVDRSIYAVMRDMGLPFSSHIGVGLYRPDAPELQLNVGRHRVDDVVEVPVTSYRDVRVGRYAHWKLLTIQGVSSAEMRAVLESAESAKVSPVVILTHTHEYARRDEGQADRVSIDHQSRTRLESLCRFLAERRDRFEVTTFRLQHERWGHGPGTDNPTLTVPLSSALRRLVQNRLRVA